MNAQQPSKSKRSPATLLIYAPVPLHGPLDALTLEGQACNGLRLWAENFERVIAAMPHRTTVAPPQWQSIDSIGPARKRIELLPLPEGYRPDRFLRALPAGRRALRDAIERADYLSFAIGGLFGDWGAVGAIEARRMGRPYAVWTDRVESQVVRRAAKGGRLRTRLRAALTHRPMAALERHVISHAAVGLFHGRETFDAYAPLCPGPSRVVHDIHLSPRDHIGAPALAAKRSGVGRGPLRIAYAGRADPMKGPFDWIETLRLAAEQGVDFRAVWAGDGPALEQMQEQVRSAGLEPRVKLAGHITDRARLLEILREAQVFLFCHKTPESPRNLIEALASGAPIVGYDSAYPRDLTQAQGGGWLTPLDDPAALAWALVQLHQDRDKLARMIAAAQLSGAPYTDEGVFAHRSALITELLPLPQEHDHATP